jgi:NAD(P)-dependent dehydrogenase (short-subunit alcohol dehydrogenase family)
MPTPIPDDELFAFAERVKGKVVVITGASDLVASRARRDRLIKIHHLGAASGIGKEVALTFARHG